MTLAYYGKSRQRQVLLAIVTFFAVTIGVVAAGGIGGVFPAARILAQSDSTLVVNGPVSGDGIVPVRITNNENPTCADVNSSWSTFKVNRDETALAGTWDTGDAYTEGGPTGGQVVISNVRTISGQVLFDWTSNFGVDAVIVKQGSDAHNVYSYSLEDFGDTGLGPSSLANNNDGISHVNFCWDADPQTNPTVSKAQDASPVDGGRFHWTITINNTQAGNAALTGFAVTDVDAQLDSISGTPSPAVGACGTLPDASPFSCNVAANSTLVLHVSKDVPEYNVCVGTSMDNTASAALASGTSITVSHSSTNITIPASEGTDCDPQILAPSITKAAVSGTASGGLATWEISVQNAGNEALPVVVNDAGATFVTQTSGVGTGSCSDTTEPFGCTVSAESTLKFTVSKPATNATCSPTTIDNQASVSWWDGDSSQTSELTASAVVQIPAGGTDCDPSVPTISKTGGNFNATTDIASWNITINNTAANSIARTVEVTDAGATLVAISGGSCTGGLPDATGPFTCDVAAGGTLVLTVTKPIPQTCPAYQVTNTASVTIGGQNIGGSPVTSASLSIPSDGSLCPPPPTLPPLILEIPTPTATAVPPTATPVPPTATPKPPEKPKVDIVEGVTTPGALSTPIAPSAGSGAPGAASTFNGLFALVGLVVLGSGLAVVAAGRKVR